MHSKDSIFNFYKKLINLRHTLEVITIGNYELIDTNDNVFAYKHTSKREQIVVAGNLSSNTESFEDYSLKGYTLLLHNYHNISQNRNLIKLCLYEGLIFYGKIKKG